MTTLEFDYVIAGSESAGAAIAGLLSEHRTLNVTYPRHTSALSRMFLDAATSQRVKLNPDTGSEIKVPESSIGWRGRGLIARKPGVDRPRPLATSSSIALHQGAGLVELEKSASAVRSLASRSFFRARQFQKRKP